jgi:hypothetical protein
VVARIKSLTGAEWPAALEELDELEDSGNVFAVCAAVAVCGRGGQWQVALKLLDRVPEPDYPLYHAVLGALAKARCGSEAEFLLFGRMKKAGLSIDSYSLNEVVAAYRGDWKQAVRIMEAAASWRQASGGESPKMGTYIAVIRACADGGAFDEAMAWLMLARQVTQLPAQLKSNSRQLENALDNDLLALSTLEQALWRQWSKNELSWVQRVVALSCRPSESSGDDSDLSGLFSFDRLAPVDRSATKELFNALGTSADEGFMPKFDNAGARSGYLVQKLVARSSRVADFLVAVDDLSLRRQSKRGTLLQGVVGDILSTPSKTRVISLGGGPGMDAVAVTLLADYQRLGGRVGGGGVDAMILDYEFSWADCVNVVGKALNAAMPGRNNKQSGAQQVEQNTAVGFGSCDITASLNHSINSAAKEYLQSAEPVIVVCSYVIAENAKALRAGRFKFFTDLAAAVPLDSVLLFTETTHRLWPDLLRASFCGVDRDDSHCQDFDVFLPTILGKHGVAVGLQKVLRSHVVQPQPLMGDLHEWLERRVGGGVNAELLRDFERDNKFHEKRLLRQQMDLEFKQSGEESRCAARRLRLETLRTKRAGGDIAYL